ncbi:MAG: hypothetical protein JNJ73_19845 [Hyphomonadaceae bacterium]|nr:hypothetical protein [Hyphomonadaceae bacterium]
MFRFIAFLGERSPAAIRFIEEGVESQAWKLAFQDRSIVLLASHATPLRRCREGVVVGRAFGSIEAVSGPALALQNVWGRYVGVWSRGDGGSGGGVVRDPIGAVPCFLTRADTCGLAFSHLEDVRGLVGEFALSKPALCRWLAGEADPSGATALQGVAALAPGDQAIWRAKRWETERVWRTGDVVHGKDFSDLSMACAAIRDAARLVVAAELDGRDKALLELSGGLDSSILAGLIREARPDIELVAITYYARDEDSDERPFARLAAQHAGARLIEAVADPCEPPLETVLDAPLSPTPCEHVTALAAPAASEAIACAEGMNALFAGQGGDHVFHDAQRPWPAADWMRHNGLGPGFCAQLRDTVAATRTSYWHILRATFAAKGFRPTPPESVVRAQRLLGGAVEAAIGEKQRDPSAQPIDLPPGKQAHARAIEAAEALWAPIGRSERIEIIHPFLALPVVEACLRTPVYLLNQGGRRRSLQRIAFAAHAPPAVLARTRKGGSSGFNLRVVEANRDFARALLLKGRLADLGLVEAKAVAGVLQRPAQASGADAAMMMRLIAAEAWLRALDTWNAQFRERA